MAVKNLIQLIMVDVVVVNGKNLTCSSAKTYSEHVPQRFSYTCTCKLCVSRVCHKILLAWMPARIFPEEQNRATGKPLALTNAFILCAGGANESLKSILCWRERAAQKLVFQGMCRKQHMASIVNSSAVVKIKNAHFVSSIFFSVKSRLTALASILTGLSMCHKNEDDAIMMP